eukprot:CAMPEP_0113618834 /NCGR_PEP_ID=MMETSP0017_2-20120614/9550_1 /TAXON_ID=2856 /ORGANISM="Cylindrotheca closterium" /LENGTH=580 /DNA_ID=CAMNT_0000528373 /DNA_START=143 /DNA_END=1885 /DNA_ORIENTATION=- /assembly_acc=CAM_ASM_000147
MPRRKNKKFKRQKRHDHNHKDECIFESSIEEDLRRQRQRQKEREKDREMLKEPEEEDRMDETDTPFVEKCETRRQDIVLRGMSTTSLVDIAQLPARSLLSVHNESPLLSRTQRNRIQNLWHSRYLLSQMHMHSKASLLYTRKVKWRNHALPDGTSAPVDLTCKSHLHSAARTLDVVKFDHDHDGGQQLPTIATTVQGGFGIFTAAYGRQDSFHTLRGLPVHSLRMHEKSGWCGTVVLSDDRYSLYKFQCYPLPDATSFFEMRLQEPVTDFVFGTDLVLFACPRYYGKATLSPTFLTLEDGREGELRCLNIQNFPHSDALRVEMTCTKEKFIAFGHRNGQVSLLDLRQSQSCCSILQHLPKDSSSSILGSATDLQFLSNNHQLLVKRSFGSTQLHDLRQMTSSSSSSQQGDSSSTSRIMPRRRATMSSSVVHHLQVPSDHGILTTASSRCNGMVVDPTCQQTLISPYIDSDHNAALGFWSLNTGTFAGKKILAKNPEQDPIFVEMCPTTTASFLNNSNNDNTNNDRRGESSRKHDGLFNQHPSSDFGVWLKCGRFSKSRAQSSKAGSLHHLSLPGASLAIN